jgi:hypothetical protein
MATAASDSNPSKVLTQSPENAAIRREGRAQTQEMDVALLRQGGIYEVKSASGSVYEVDVLQRAYTCPDNPPSVAVNTTDAFVPTFEQDSCPNQTEDFPTPLNKH